jgi:hypothetical protein
VSGKGLVPLGEVMDLAALMGHLDAALVVIDRLNARKAGTVDGQHRARIAALADALFDEIDSLVIPNPDPGASS